MLIALLTSGLCYLWLRKKWPSLTIGERKSYQLIGIAVFGLISGLTWLAVLVGLIAGSGQLSRIRIALKNNNLTKN